MTAPLFLSSGHLLADRRFEFAADLAARGDLAAAADLLQQALDLAPDFVSAWFALGDLRERLGEPQDAIAAFRRVREIDPSDRHGAALRLTRLGAGEAGAMPEAYVATLFDQYAARFDAALVDGLAYQGPALLRAAVMDSCAAQGIAPRFAALLDLGCGTGLAGAALRDLAGTLTGVDLSAGMLAAARAKDIYTVLRQSEVTAFLAEAVATEIPHQGDAADGQRACYDLVVAADVFAYFPDLAPVAAAVARALAPGGLFAFTTETHAGAGVVLGDKLRYAHGESHVRAALAAAGLTLLDLHQASTRNEAGAPVPGLVVVARR
jgi:predicted TPR repeat methyltransferase